MERSRGQWLSVYRCLLRGYCRYSLSHTVVLKWHCCFPSRPHTVALNKCKIHTKKVWSHTYNLRTTACPELHSNSQPPASLASVARAFVKTSGSQVYSLASVTHAYPHIHKPRSITIVLTHNIELEALRVCGPKNDNTIWIICSFFFLSAYKMFQACHVQSVLTQHKRRDVLMPDC